MDKNEQKLRIERMEVFTLVMAFPQPASAYKIQKEYEDCFDCPINHRAYGYVTLEGYLNDHPDLMGLLIDGKRHYTAKISEKTADIQSLVSRQKKKKKSKGRGGSSAFQRNTRGTRSMGARGGAQRYNNARSSMREYPSTSGYHNPGSSSSWRGQSVPRGSFYQQYQPNAFAPIRVMESNPFKTQNRVATVTPAQGVARIMKALDLCSGRATPTRLNLAYKSLFNVEFNASELEKYFGTRNMRNVHADHLADEFDFHVVGGCWMLVSKAIGKQREEWNTLHRDAAQTVEVEAPPKKWDKPSLPKLYFNVIEMLVNMYPNDLAVDNMSTIYDRTFNVMVDPLQLYAKSWEILITTTFKEKLELNGNRVCLRQSVVAARNLKESVPEQKKKVTATDLGFDMSDDEDEESDSVSQASEISDVSSLMSASSTPVPWSASTTTRVPASTDVSSAPAPEVSQPLPPSSAIDRPVSRMGGWKFGKRKSAVADEKKEDEPKIEVEKKEEQPNTEVDQPFVRAQITRRSENFRPAHANPNSVFARLSVRAAKRSEADAEFARLSLREPRTSATTEEGVHKNTSGFPQQKAEQERESTTNQLPLPQVQQSAPHPSGASSAGANETVKVEKKRATGFMFAAKAAIRNVLTPSSRRENNNNTKDNKVADVTPSVSEVVAQNSFQVKYSGPSADVKARLNTPSVPPGIPARNAFPKHPPGLSGSTSSKNQ